MSDFIDHVLHVARAGRDAVVELSDGIIEVRCHADGVATLIANMPGDDSDRRVVAQIHPRYPEAVAWRRVAQLLGLRDAPELRLKIMGAWVTSHPEVFMYPFLPPPMRRTVWPAGSREFNVPPHTVAGYDPDHGVWLVSFWDALVDTSTYASPVVYVTAETWACATPHDLRAALALLAADDYQRQWRNSRRYADPPDLIWDPQHWQ